LNSDDTTADLRIADAWGDALNDHLDGRAVDELLLEVDDGTVVPAMDPEWFFRTEPDWEPEERRLIEMVTHGPVLDLGAGAGRVALHLQERGLRVTAVESSPGAARVCRRRGVRDVRVQDLNSPPADQAWRTILLLCGNLGLGGSWDGNRRLLVRLAEISAPDAVLLADSVDYTGRAEIGLRIRYADQVTPWWRQRNVSAAEVDALVEGTGWTIAHHLRAPNGSDHYVAMTRT
jgi:SAM-dependent methyltransferase